MEMNHRVEDFFPCSCFQVECFMLPVFNGKIIIGRLIIFAECVVNLISLDSAFVLHSKGIALCQIWDVTFECRKN